jgi:hypothetical protein
MNYILLSRHYYPFPIELGEEKIAVNLVKYFLRFFRSIGTLSGTDRNRLTIIPTKQSVFLYYADNSYLFRLFGYNSFA